MKKQLKVLMMVFMAIFLVTGCSVKEEEPKAKEPKTEQEAKIIHATVNVTKDNGKEKILSTQIEFNEGDNLLDAMKTSIPVTDKKGMVTAISGVESDTSKKKAWFVTVNGELAETGAKDIILKDGDLVFWDLHSWE